MIGDFIKGNKDFSVAIVTSVTSVITVIISTLLVVYEINKKDANHIETSKEIKTALITSIESLNGYFGVFMDSFPYPIWVKTVELDENGEVEFRMLYINDAYENFFNIKKENYIGKTDYRIWDPQTANRFYENDLHVYITKRPTKFKEIVMVNGKNMELTYTKTPITKGHYKGIIGYMIPSGENQEIINNALEDAINSNGSLLDQ
jgi:PAS domain-containing protein